MCRPLDALNAGFRHGFLKLHPAACPTGTVKLTTTPALSSRGIPRPGSPTSPPMAIDLRVNVTCDIAVQRATLKKEPYKPPDLLTASQQDSIPATRQENFRRLEEFHRQHRLLYATRLAHKPSCPPPRHAAAGPITASATVAGPTPTPPHHLFGTAKRPDAERMRRSAAASPGPLGGLRPGFPPGPDRIRTA